MSSLKKGNLSKAFSALPKYNDKKDPSQFTTKDKRYIQQVEKAITVFDSVVEWADYISFLSKLQKALQSHTSNWIPQSFDIAKRLAFCLAANLPSGVHRKTLEIYDLVFKILGSLNLNKEVSIWVPGLLPLMSYASISIKPQLIQIFEVHILNLDRKQLEVISKPLLMSLLPGLDDETSESFQQTFDLVEKFKENLMNNTHFWQCLFLVIITNPDKRLGALVFCNKKLPSFTPLKAVPLNQTSNGKESETKALKSSVMNLLSEEARCCVSPESGLMIRAFCNSLNDENLFVQRGFFDLLLSKIELNSGVIQVLIDAKDKESLIMSACRTVLRKDMSLNRRLWNWLLGPEVEVLSPAKVSDSRKPEVEKMSRSEYFQTYGLDSLVDGLLKSIKGEFDSDSPEKQKMDSFKIALSILDKWEMGQMLIPKILIPILQSCYDSSDQPEVLKSATTFFDGVEAINIWGDVLNLILNEKNLNLVEFVLKNFNIEEEEMIINHLPLVLLSLLLTNDSYKMCEQWLEIVHILIDLIPERAYLPIEHCHKKYFDECRSLETRESLRKETIEKISKYYFENMLHETVPNPFPPADLALLTLQSINLLVIDSFQEEKGSYSLCDILSLLLNKVPHSSKSWKNEDLLTTILTLSDSCNIEFAFSISKIFNHLVKSTSLIDQSKLLKIVLNNFWQALVDPYISSQVETVKSIIDLEMSVDSHYIEAGLSHLFLNTQREERIRAFNTLWTHSLSFNESDVLLVRPLQLLLDNLDSPENPEYIVTSNFVQSAMKSGSNNRLLKMVSLPLLNNTFITKKQFSFSDDLKLYNYQLTTISNLVKVNKRLISDTFNSELVVIDNNVQLTLVKENKWDISTYKSLILLVIQKFVSLELPQDYDLEFVEIYCSSIRLSLDLLELLVNGNESDFKALFSSLVEACSYFSEMEKTYINLDLIEIIFLRSISTFLKTSERLKIDLSLLNQKNDSTEPFFVQFLNNGIMNAKSSILLKEWIQLLLKSIYIFEDSMFGVILSLSDTIIQKIDLLFASILKNSPRVKSESALPDVEQSLTVLMGGIEDMLSIVHGYLLSREARSNSNAKSTSDPGFFGTVIQGVFQVESPMARTAEENKRLSVLLCFQDAVKSCFKIWLWAEERTKLNFIDDFTSTTRHLNFEKTTNFLATKFKFRSKKLLETLYNLEPIEVLETLIDYDPTSLIFKLLNILDGGRPQLTIPFIFDSLISRVYPQLLETKKQSLLNIDISAKRLSSFLADYIVCIDNDSIEDIWSMLMQFFRDILSHTNSFKFVFPDILKFINNLSLKLTKSKFGDQKRIKKELAEICIKVLYPTLSAKTPDKFLGALIPTIDDSASVYDDELPSTPTDTKTSSTVITQEDVVDSINFILPNLGLILQDTDKTSSVISSIIVNIITPSLRSKKLKEIPVSLIQLLDSIGDKNQIKLWKSSVHDCFIDPAFFQNNSGKSLEIWNSIISKWIIQDKDKFGDFINKIQPYSTNSTLFSWNDSEIESRILHLKRVAYLLMTQPKDFFLNDLEELFHRVSDTITNSNSKALRVDMLILLRCIILKFSELHLLPYWVIIYSELQSIFYSVLESEDPRSLEASDLNIVLAGSKLLDVLLIVGYEEFKLNEWLFVIDNTDAVYRTNEAPVLSLVDRISSMNELGTFTSVSIKISDDHEEKMNSFDMKMKPFLRGVRNITTIGNLKSFFDSLSLYNFERNYSLDPADVTCCESDAFDDLFYSI